jgi:hypothetical protein
VIIEVRGENPPGLGCLGYRNIHVGVGVKQVPVGLVPADRPARWRVEVRTVSSNGTIDFRGPFVHGPRNERFLYLNWGELDEHGAFTLFRRAKIVLSDIRPALVDAALGASGALTCTVDLTDEKGNPSCAKFREIVWNVCPNATSEVLTPP